MNLLAAARTPGAEPAQNPYTDPVRGSAGRAVAGKAERPSSVDAGDWDFLAANVARVLGSGSVDGQLERAVQLVVRSMRQARTPWDAIYVALASSLAPEESPRIPTPRGMEIHPTRGAALVAHMHCWADCVRLQELEHGE